MDLQDSPQKEKLSPVTSLPRCPECRGWHVELVQVEDKTSSDLRSAWYCIDCCFSWFR